MPQRRSGPANWRRLKLPANAKLRGFDIVLDTGFGINMSQDDIAETFSPFVAREFYSEDDGEWRALIKGRGRKILKGRLRRQFLGWQTGAGRAPNVVEQIYEKNWHATSLARLVDQKARAVPCVWGQKRVHLQHPSRLIERLQPSSVLEVGCGIDINLFVLRPGFPR